jgi:hypothetical protein
METAKTESAFAKRAGLAMLAMSTLICVRDYARATTENAPNLAAFARQNTVVMIAVVSVPRTAPAVARASLETARAWQCTLCLTALPNAAQRIAPRPLTDLVWTVSACA